MEHAAPALVLHAQDNVAVLLRDVAAGEPVVDGAGRRLAVATEPIAAGHKVAIRPIGRHAAVVKYGVPVGRATAGITPGEHVHVHNVESVRLRGDLAHRNG